MAMKQVIEIFELLDIPKIEEDKIKAFFLEKRVEEKELEMKKVKEEGGETLFLKDFIPLRLHGTFEEESREVFLNRKITGLSLYHYRLSLLCLFHQGIPEEGLDTVLIVQ